MTLLERLHIGYQSQIGTLLIALLFFLALLGLIYWLLLWRQKRKDQYAYLYRAHYEKAEQLARSMRLIGSPKSDFFGRQSFVQLDNGKRGVCLIPPPQFALVEIRDRFRFFCRAIENTPPPLVAPYIWKEDQESLILVQGHLLRQDGRPLLNMKFYLFDKKLTEPDQEKILFNIARALAELHDIQTELGSSLYHGFLLPRSIFIDFDATYTIRKIVLADTGLAFAMGPQKMFQGYLDLREGRLPIEKFYAHELLEQISMLAPEQRNPHRLDEVSPAVDFFSYAALAVTLFTKRRFNQVQAINWNDIPIRWRPFLKSSLEERPEKRPKDFLELEDWLNDPELALTNQMNEIKSERVEVEPVDDQKMTLSEMKDRIQDMSRESNSLDLPTEKANQLAKWLETGARTMNTSKWEEACKCYLEALKLSPRNAEIHVKLAIVYYEMGDFKEAEFFYQKAKQNHPRLAKGFREHIAFKV